MGDKCERCGRVESPTSDGCRAAYWIRQCGHSAVDTREIDECHLIAYHERALPEIARLTAENATLRAQLADAVARWEAAEQSADRLGCMFVLRPQSVAFRYCAEAAAWSHVDKAHRCPEHTTKSATTEAPTK